MNEIANLLESLQANENGGRGISFVRSIVHYLRIGDTESARNVWRNDGDKAHQYPTVYEKLTEIFGARG
jgi:hypothetical protein